MFRLLRGLWRASRGATAIEYGLIAGLLALVLVGALTQLGTALNTSYNGVSTTVSAA